MTMWTTTKSVENHGEIKIAPVGALFTIKLGG